MEWNYESSLSLIDQYHTRRVLWDPKHPSYYLKSMKWDAWTNIADAYGLEVKEIRKKMDSLLSSFRRERAKCLRGNYKSRWFAFNKLSFLMELKADTVDNLDSTLDKGESSDSRDVDQNSEPLEEVKKGQKRSYSDDDDDEPDEYDVITPMTSISSMKGKEWNNASCLTLINMYKTRRVLWHPKHSFYYSKVKKHKAWTSIADHFNLEVEEIRKKMESLLGSLRRERSKTRNSNGRYRSSWYAFNSMSFLLDRFENNDTNEGENNTEINDESGDEEQNSLDLNKMENMPEFVDQDALMSVEEPEIFSVPIQPKKKISKKLCTEDEDPRIEEAYRILKTSAAHETSVEYEAFGKYIASKFRTFSAKTRVIVEYGISNMLFHAALGTYDNDPSLTPKVPTIQISQPYVFHNTTAESFIDQSYRNNIPTVTPSSSTSHHLLNQSLIPSTTSEEIVQDESDPLEENITLLDSIIIKEEQESSLKK